MPRTHPPYAPEYRRRRLVELVRAGRPITELAREFEASANAIRKWVKQAALDEGLRSDGLTTTEREELSRAAAREPRAARRARDTIKSRGLVRDGDRLGGVAAFQFVSANQAMYKIATICRVLGVSPSGYHGMAEAAAIGAGACRRGTHLTHHRDSSILAHDLRRAADSPGTISSWQPGRT
jgi:transposase